MGNAASSIQTATHCIYKKTDFKDVINLIRDAHSVMQYYASLSLLPRLPSDLQSFKNFNEISEAYFNIHRKDNIPALTAINPVLKSYFDVYALLNALKFNYTKSTDDQKRALVEDAFNACYAMLTSLIEELNESCQVQK